MDRRAFLTNMLHGTLATLLTPGIVPQLLIRQYAARTQIDWSSEDVARITAIGIGQSGASCTRLLAYNMTNITCHDVVFNPTTTSNTSDLASLFTSIRESDLLFLVTSYDDPYCEAIFAACVETAESVGVLTVGVVPQSDNTKLTSSASGAIFALPSSQRTPYARQQHIPPTNNVAFQLVTSISSFLLTQGYIGIDFADVTAILRSGKSGWLGVGTASGERKVRSTASVALEDLNKQGVDFSKCSGLLACLHTSLNPPAVDFLDELAEPIVTYLGTDIGVLINYSTEIRAGSSDRVVIIAII